MKAFDIERVQMRKKRGRDPEHIRRYDQFKQMERWVKEGENGSMYAHFGKVIKKVAVKRKRHPGYDAVDIVRNIYQGTDEEVVIMEDGAAWKIKVVDFPVDQKYSGPLGDVSAEQKQGSAQDTKPKRSRFVFKG